MSRSRRVAVVVLLLLLAGLLTAAPVSADPPDSSGVVERGETEFSWWDFDERSGLAVLFGMDPQGWCRCAGFPPPDGNIDMLMERMKMVPALADTSFEGVPIPDESSFVTHVKGDEVQARVWALNEAFFTDFLFLLEPDTPFDEFHGLFCGWYGTEEPITQGTVKLRFTDNDVLANISDNHRANAWGLVANGNMDDGFHLHATVKLVWSGDPDNPWMHLALNIKLH